MTVKKKTTEKAVSKKEIITDAYEEVFVDEEGNRKLRRVFMNDKKKVREEIRNI